MSALIPSVRIAAEMPSPVCLADYEPFRALTPGQFGITEKEHVGETTLARIRDCCRRGFGAAASVGFCTLARPQAVFFDMDATVIREESIVVLAGYLGKDEEIARITEAAMSGQLDFETALRQRVGLLKGLSLQDLARAAESLTLNPGIQAFVAFCRELGVPTFLVSGGFVRLAEVIARKVGFERVHANQLVDDGEALTGELNGVIVDAQRKKSFMEEVCKERGFDPALVAAVGDGANDLPILQSVGCPVGYQPKEVLYDHVHAVIGRDGHRFLGPLLFGRDLTMVRRRSRV